jgi:hypothetical protein
MVYPSTLAWADLRVCLVNYFRVVLPACKSDSSTDTIETSFG